MSRYWEVRYKGFLPALDPPEKYTVSGRKEHLLIQELSQMLPHLARMRSVREEMVARLRTVDQNSLYSWIDNELSLTDEASAYANIERMWRDFSYFASMYIWAPGETPQKRLPREIAVPFNYLAKKLDRKPILSYMAYCLTNWKQIRPIRRGRNQSEEQYIESYVDGIRLGNIKLIQNFTCDYKRDEDWFVLVHVDIEARASKGIKSIMESVEPLTHRNQEGVRKCLETLCESIKDMNSTLDRMPEECSPDVYYDKVRPYIWSFEDVMYEGISSAPETYRGETGAQSSIIPAMQAALGIKHGDTVLTKHLKDMRNYMPKEHRLFLAQLEERPEHISLRNFATDNLAVRQIYNECVKQLFRFRNTHLKYAVDYIQKKCDNPKGTGGTPYVPWLTQLTKETESFYL